MSEWEGGRYVGGTVVGLQESLPGHAPKATPRTEFGQCIAQVLAQMQLGLRVAMLPLRHLIPQVKELVVQPLNRLLAGSHIDPLLIHKLDNLDVLAVA